MLTICDKLGPPVKPEKVEGPTTLMEFLGILLDSINMTAGISPARKAELTAELLDMASRTKCRKHDLLSLIGKLSFACKVVPAGRIFLRRLIDRSCTVKHLHHWLCLTKKTKADLQWWLHFLPNWLGTCLMLESEWTPAPAMQLYMDASSTLGYGAYWQGHWFKSKWTTNQQEYSIQWKELYVIVAAAQTGGQLWSQKPILFYCYNQAVTEIWRTGTSRSPELMHLIRSLYFIAANNNFTLLFTHIQGSDNNMLSLASRWSVSSN